MKRWLLGFCRNELGQISYRGWEWLLMRLLFAAVLWKAADQLVIVLQGYDTIRRPHGLGYWWDITFVGQDPWESRMPAIFYGLILLYVTGLLPVVSLTGLFVLHTLMGTFSMSQGASHHIQQIVGFVLLGQCLAAIWALWKTRTWGHFLRPERVDYRDRMVFWSQQMVAASYTVTGLTKLVRSEGKWLEEIPNLVVQFEKNLLMEFYNKLAPSSDKVTVMMVDFINRFPLVAQAMFGTVLLAELLAFFALWNRRIMAIWGLILISMHVVIGVVMKLHFEYNQWVVAIFLVNVPFWICALVRQRGSGG